MEGRRKLHRDLWHAGHDIAKDNCTISAKKSQEQGLRSFRSCIGGFSRLFHWNRYLGRKLLANSTSTAGRVGLRAESSEDYLSSMKPAGTGYVSGIMVCTNQYFVSQQALNDSGTYGKLKTTANGSHPPAPHTELRHLLHLEQEPFVLQEAILEKQHAPRRKIDTNPSRDNPSTDKSTEIKVVDYINLYRNNRKLAERRPVRSDSYPDRQVIKFDHRLNENQRTTPPKSSFFSDVDGVSVKSDHNHERSLSGPSEARVSITVTSPARPSATLEGFSSAWKSCMICGSKQHKSRVPGKKEIRRKAKLMEAAHRILEGSSRSSRVTALTVNLIADNHRGLFGHQTVMEAHGKHLGSSRQLDQEDCMSSYVGSSSEVQHSDIKPTTVRKKQKKKSKLGSSVHENAQNITTPDEMEWSNVVTLADCVEEDTPDLAVDANAKPFSEAIFHVNDSIAAEYQSGVVINASFSSPLRLCDFSWWDAMEQHEAKAMEQFPNDHQQVMDSHNDPQSPPPCLQQRRKFHRSVDSDDSANVAMRNKNTTESGVKSDQTIDDCQEQLSPVSVLDPPFIEDESNCLDEISNDDFEARFEESRQHLLEKVCRLEQLAEMDMETFMKTYGEIEESYHLSTSDAAYSDSEQSAGESEPSISYQLPTSPEHDIRLSHDHLSSALVHGNRRVKANYHHRSQIKKSARARVKHSAKPSRSRRNFQWCGNVNKTEDAVEMEWMSEGARQAITEEVGSEIVSNLSARLIEELLLEMM